MSKRRLRLVDALRRAHPRVSDAEEAIRGGRVTVRGVPVRNPASLVAEDAPLAVVEEKPLRGEVKLRAAIAAFGPPLHGVVALDLGAAAGGFTKALLEAGARRVYAVDVGFGQLLGSLRQDPRVVNLERTNVAELTPELVLEPVDLVTIDLSYLSLAEAVPQLKRIVLSPDARLLALVKPQFELHRAEPPTDPSALDEALATATARVREAGWEILGSRQSPVRGTRGSIEFFLYAGRSARPSTPAPPTGAEQ